MKRILSFVLCTLSLCHFASLFAAEKIVWTGDEPISWNTEVYEGTQFETPEGIFSDLRKDDTIRVNVVAHIDEPQYVLTYKAGDSWAWTDLENAHVIDGLMTYIVESEQIADEIAGRGLIFRGQGYNITQIAVASSDKEPEPQPSDTIDYTGLIETVVYAPATPIAISWNTTEYEGTKLDTRVINEVMFAGLQEDHIIRISIVEAAADAEYSLQYKAGDDWTWTDLNWQLSTVDSQLYLAYKVESDNMAMLIADRGLIIQGIRYKVSGISVFGNSTLSIEQTNDRLPTSDHQYNIFGQRVDAGYHGIVICNGQKYLR